MVISPEQNGADLLVQIAKDYPGFKCVLVSGRSNGQNAARDDIEFISKPLVLAKLEDMFRDA